MILPYKTLNKKRSSFENPVIADYKNYPFKISLTDFLKKRRFLKRIRGKPPKEKKLTILASLLGKDCLVVASDSQTTGDNTKWQDALKIVRVDLLNGAMLVAQAGTCDTSQRVIEILSELSKDQNISDYRGGADLLRDAIIQTKREIKMQQGDCTEEELREFISDYDLDCSFLLAYFFNLKPYVFKANFLIGGVNWVNPQHWATLGSGELVADFLFRDYSKPKMPLQNALVSVIKIIESVKRVDTYCSGSTMVGIIQVGYQFAPEPPDVFVNILGSSYVKELADQISEIDIKTMKSHSEHIETLLIERTQKLIASLNFGLPSDSDYSPPSE